MAITDREKHMAAAMAAIDWERPIVIETTLSHVIGIVGLVQLALRFPPARMTPSGQMTEKFIKDLIEKIDPEHGETWKTLQRGFNPEWDV